MASPLRRLLPYHERYKLPFWGGIAGLLVARLFEAFIPLFLKDGIDAVATRDIDAAATIRWCAIAISGLVLVRFVLVAYARRAVRRIGVHVAYDLRQRVYDHLQHQGPGFFAKFPTGDLMARAINDISLIRQLIAMGLRTILVLAFSAVIGLVFMVALAPQLTLLLMLPLPLVAVLGWFLSRRVFQRSMRVQEGFADMSEQVQENLNGIRTVQALVQEQNEIARFDAVNLEYINRFLALTRSNSFIASAMPWMGAFSTAIILGYGGSLVFAGELSIGTFTALFSYASMVLWPVAEAGQMVTLWQQGASGAERLFEVLDHEPEIADRPNKSTPARITGRLEFRDFVYRYPGAAFDALAGVELDIETGETIAILGRVGAGKTTLLKSLVRLIEPPPGMVKVDGWDVRDYPLAQLRSEIVLVPQESFLFADILRNNLSYDTPEREEQLVWNAASDADLEDTIHAFPEKMATAVGERGVTLSGGQKQRSTLARGLVRDAPVLVLDDCFSSVDTETEEHILERLYEARRGKTTVMVSHRVSTARQADRIVVVDAGRISEIGTHDELIALDGWYAELERNQRRRGRLVTELEQA